MTTGVKESKIKTVKALHKFLEGIPEICKGTKNRAIGSLGNNIWIDFNRD